MPGGCYPTNTKLNYSKLIPLALTRLDLLPGLLHELLVAGEGFAHGLEAFAQLLAVPDLVFDSFTQLRAQLFPVLIRAGLLLLNLVPELLLILLARLFHFLDRVLHAVSQAILQTCARAILIERGTAGLQLVSIPLLDLITLWASPLCHCGYASQQDSNP